MRAESLTRVVLAGIVLILVAGLIFQTVSCSNTTQQGASGSKESGYAEASEMQSPGNPAEPGPYKSRELSFPDLTDRSRNQKVPLKVFFPAESGSFPLVVMSHGAGGSWDAFIYQAQHLASHGYVVMCPQHKFSDNEQFKYLRSRAGGKLRPMKAIHYMTKDPKAVLGRPKDISFAIDQSIQWNKTHDQLKGKIDASKVAVMGHSLGAYTAMAVCGARPILDYLEPPVAPGKGLGPDLSDPRVAFGFAMSPQSPGSTVFGVESYKSINRPMVFVSGSKDDQKGVTGNAMPAETRRDVMKYLPSGRKYFYFYWLKNADHNSFWDGPSARWFRSSARPDAQRITKALMVLYSDYYLKGKKAAAEKFNAQYVNSLTGKEVSQVSVEQK